MKNYNSNTEYLHPKIILEIILDNYKIFLKTTLVFSLIALLLFALSEKKYLSSATIFPSSGDDSSSMLSTIQGLGLGLGGQGFSNDGIYSSDIYESILQSKRLAKETITHNFYIDDIKMPLYKILFTDENNKFTEEQIINMVADDFVEEKLSVYRSPGKSVITVSVIMSDPFLAKSVLDVLLINMNKIYQDHNLSKNLLKLDFISDRVESNDKDLTKTEEKYENFLYQNKNFGDSPSLIILQSRLQRELDVLEALSLSLKKEYESIKLETIDKSTAISILDSPEIPLEPSSPNLILNLLVGLIIAILFSCVSIYFKYTWRK